MSRQTPGTWPVGMMPAGRGRCFFLAIRRWLEDGGRKSRGVQTANSTGQALLTVRRFSRNGAANASSSSEDGSGTAEEYDNPEPLELLDEDPHQSEDFCCGVAVGSSLAAVVGGAFATSYVTATIPKVTDEIKNSTPKPT